MQLLPSPFSMHKGVILDPSVAQIYFPLGPTPMQVLLQFIYLLLVQDKVHGTINTKFQAEVLACV